MSAPFEKVSLILNLVAIGVPDTHHTLSSTAIAGLHLWCALVATFCAYRIGIKLERERQRSQEEAR